MSLLRTVGLPSGTWGVPPCHWTLHGSVSPYSTEVTRGCHLPEAAQPVWGRAQAVTGASARQWGEHVPQGGGALVGVSKEAVVLCLWLPNDGSSQRGWLRTAGEALP